MGGPTRLKVIAERLNLSQSTVSRALNDYQDISDKTKQLVRKAADELGYQPNMHARRLALGKSETLGYVMPWQDRRILSQRVDGRHGQGACRLWLGPDCAGPAQL